MTRAPYRVSRPLHCCRNGLGGFYEAILALMIVTAGVVLLTTSLTFLIPETGDEALEHQCQEILSSVFGDPTLAPADRTLDQRALTRHNWTSCVVGWDGGVRLFLTFPDGSTDVLFQNGESDAVERRSLSEPVNVLDRCSGMSVATLTVWVWR